jgi:hypothetical protein
MPGREDAFRSERRAVTVTSLRGIDEPLGECHLVFGKPEAVHIGGHGAGARLQVSPGNVEIAALGSGGGPTFLLIMVVYQSNTLAACENRASNFPGGVAGAAGYARWRTGWQDRRHSLNSGTSLNFGSSPAAR